MKKSKIAVLIPCYNESKTIEKVVKDYRKELPEADIYVYDNNSNDDTDKIAKKAVVLTNQKEDEIAKYDNVSGGFFRILEKSSIIHFKKIYKPRIVLGTNENGTEIFFFATNSMSYEQCAQVLLGLGCTDALLMDGGSSTQICLNKKQLIHIPFRRKVPTFLGLVKSDSK